MNKFNSLRQIDGVQDLAVCRINHLLLSLYIVLQLDLQSRNSRYDGLEVQIIPK